VLSAIDRGGHGRHPGYTARQIGIPTTTEAISTIYASTQSDAERHVYHQRLSARAFSERSSRRVEWQTAADITTFPANS